VNLGGEHTGNTGKTLKNPAGTIEYRALAGFKDLQNLSNYPAKTRAEIILRDMANIKIARIVFYTLATLELILLSALYSWAQVAR
jgi:hypothetical protein